MLGREDFIVNNILTKDGVDYKIYIDFGFIINLDTGLQTSFRLEETGITINGFFKSFKDYVFAIQNNSIQYSGMCTLMHNIRIASNHVRIEKKNNITHCVIIDNAVVEDVDDGYMFLDIGTYAQETRRNLNNTHNDCIIMNQTKENNIISLDKIARDPQNVHESIIIKRFEIVYKKMLTLIERNTIMQNYSMLKFSKEDAIKILQEKTMNCSDIYRLNNVIDYCIRHNGYIYNIGDRECNILRNIIIYILKCVNSSSQEDIFLILAENMIDCIENNSIVCLTGRVMRVINSIQHFVEEHLNDSEKYLNIEDARKDMLTFAMNLYNQNMSLEKIRDSVIKKWHYLNKLDLEIDSWGLEDLY